MDSYGAWNICIFSTGNLNPEVYKTAKKKAKRCFKNGKKMLPVKAPCIHFP